MTDAVTVDARGMRCPWPVLRLARAMRGARQVILLADDPVAGQELAALANAQGWRIVEDGRSGMAQQWRVSR